MCAKDVRQPIEVKQSVDVCAGGMRRMCAGGYAPPYISAGILRPKKRTDTYKEIIVTRADKEAGTPTTKSRWLQRLEVVINALGLNGDIDDGATEKDWLAKIEPKAIPQLAVRPSPCPPRHLSPHR